MLEILLAKICPAANTVDTEAAEPLFIGRVRAPGAPLLGQAALKVSRKFNLEMHPKVSGVTLAELRLRLEKYIDRTTLEALVRQANAASPGAYPGDEATMVTLLAHQFQRKTCRAPSIGGVTRACTSDGRLAEDTLDALGFVYHKGRKLNVADRANSTANGILRRTPASAFVGVAPGLSAKTWFPMD